MKRTLIASILGITLSALNSHADTGQILFSTYFSSFPRLVAWGDSASGHTAGQWIESTDNFHGVLFYGMGAGLSFNQLAQAPSSETLVGVLLPGSIIGYTVTLPNWTPGSQVTFGIEAYNGDDYQSSTYKSLNDVTWTEPSTTVKLYDPLVPPNQFTEALFAAAYPNGLRVYPVPEPGLFSFVTMGATVLWMGKRPGYLRKK